MLFGNEKLMGGVVAGCWDCNEWGFFLGFNCQAEIIILSVERLYGLISFSLLAL